MAPASKYFTSGEISSVDLNDDERKMAEEIRASCLFDANPCSSVSYTASLALHVFSTAQNCYQFKIVLYPAMVNFFENTECFY